MRRYKCFMLFLLKVVGSFRIARYLTRKKVRILGYHGVWLGEDSYRGDGMFMNKETFAIRLMNLSRWRYPVLSLDYVVSSIPEETLPPCPVVITIDDGWYSTYVAMLPALNRHGMHATIYCDTAHLISGLPVPHVMARYFMKLYESGCAGHLITPEHNCDLLFQEAINLEGTTIERLERVRKFANSISINFDYYVENGVFNYMSAEQLKTAYQSGFDVQLHTHNHTMHNMCEHEIENEILSNRLTLSEILGVEQSNFKHFCYPSGEYSTNTGCVLDHLGIKSSTTTDRAMADPLDKKQYLPRILDGEHLTPIEFEAELCGVMECLRLIRKFMKRVTKTNK